MQLVYPIYLDIPMMTGFLASLEDGLIEETDMQTRNADAKESTKSASVKAKLSGLLSQILDVEASGDIAKKLSETLEAEYKSTVRYPSASLFIRLRELLLEQELAKLISGVDDFASINLGDIVEFQGDVVPNPSYQIRRAFNQLLPLIEAIQAPNIANVDLDIAVLKAARPGVKIVVSGEEIDIPSNNPTGNQQIKLLLAQQESKKQQLLAQGELYKAMGAVFNGLFPEDELDTLLFKSAGFSAISRVYPTLARNERLQDIPDATWHCLGKVIGIIAKSDQFDLLRGAPISYLASMQFAELATLFNNDSVKVELTEPQVKGPALIVATLAIFA